MSKENTYDTLDPFSLANERYRVWITIDDRFVSIVGAQTIRGRAVKIKLQTGPDKVEVIPSNSKIGIWTKGRPADIVYDSLPGELKLIDIRHIQSIRIDVDQLL